MTEEYHEIHKVKNHVLSRSLIPQWLHIYYINLKDSIERDTQIQNSFKLHGISNVHRIEGINGKENVKEKLRFRKINKTLSATELGCVCSHIKAISSAYNDGHEMALIMEDDCNFEYLQYHDYTLDEFVRSVELSDAKKYDVYQLGVITPIATAEKMVHSERLVSKFFCDSAVCYLITRIGMRKILQCKKPLTVADNYMYVNLDVCVANRPYFTYYYSEHVYSTIRTDTDSKNNKYADESKRYFDHYYKSISLWDRIYCVNLGMDVVKYYNMMKYCRFFNKKPENFFYSGLFGKNYPDDLLFESVIDSGLVDRSILNVPEVSQRYGMIGLNVTNRDIFTDAETNNYQKILLLEDDIIIHNHWIDQINRMSTHIERSDVLYLGSSMYMTSGQIYEAFDNVDLKSMYDANNTNSQNSLFKVKDKVFNQHYGIAGGFGISFSSKAVKLLLNHMKVQNNVSDRLYSSVIFNHISNFNTGLNSFDMTDPNHLESYIIIPNLIDAILKKVSLTDSIQIPPYFEKDSQIVIDTMIQINRINYKIRNKQLVKILISSRSTHYFKKKIYNILMKNNIKFIDHGELNDTSKRFVPDIVFYDGTKSSHTAAGLSILIKLSSHNNKIYVPYDLQFDGSEENVSRELERIIIDRKRKILCAYDRESTYSVEKLRHVYRDGSYDMVIRFSNSDLSNYFLYQYHLRSKTVKYKDDYDVHSNIVRDEINEIDGSFMIRKISDVINMQDQIHIVDMSNPDIIDIDYAHVIETNFKEAMTDPFCAQNRMYNYQRDLRRLSKLKSFPLSRDPISLQIVDRIITPVETRLGIQKDNNILWMIRRILFIIIHYFLKCLQCLVIR